MNGDVNDFAGLKIEDRGNYRSLYSTILDDSDYMNLPERSRHVLLVLKISRVSNFSGIFVVDEGELVTLKKQTGIELSELLHEIDFLERENWVYYVPPVLWIRNALKFEPSISLKNKYHRKSIAKKLLGLPRSPLVVAFCQYYGLDIPPNYSEKLISSVKSLNIKWSNEPVENREIKSPDKDSNGDKPSKDYPYEEIISYLNNKVNCSFNFKTEIYQQLIRARIDAGATVEDFKTIINKKFEDWTNTEYEKYLKPSTLFRKSKFDEYLNQIIKSNNKKPEPKRGEGEAKVEEI